MRSKNKKKYCFLSVLLALMLAFSFVVPAFAVELTEEQSQALDAAVDKYKKTEKEMAETKNTIKELEAEMEELQGIIDGLDARMAETKEEIAELEAEIAAREAEAEERFRVMYMYGNDGYWEMLFSANDFAELLTRIDLVRSVMQSDRDCVNAIQKAKDKISEEIASQEADKASTEVLKAKQEALLSSNQALLQTQQIQQEIEKNEANEMAKAWGYYGIDEYVNELAWPFSLDNPSAFHISDVFGYRTWGSGWTEFHAGMDLIPGAGTEILAAASGIVALADSNGSGYGNYVILEHGKNDQGQTIRTVYGHMSHFIVSKGESVVQGQVIGYVGSTGFSTGPHLHFEVRLNETQVDPMIYFEHYRDRMYY